MAYRIEFTETANADLTALHDWIADRAGRATADAYEDRLIDHVETLTNFPARGTRYDSIRPGLRGITFERRLTIFYLIERDVVRVTAIIGAMRDRAALKIH